MHSAFLPTHESFAPRKNGPGSFLPSWAIRTHHITPSYVARWTIFICGLSLLYRVLFVPWYQVPSSFKYMSETDETWQYYDLSHQTTSVNADDAKSRGERILICMPLRNSETVMELAFSHLQNMTYPHGLIDIAILISDSTDGTSKITTELAQRVQNGPEKDRFHKIDIFHKDFGASIGQGFSDRHGVKVQGSRRKLMGRARNWLLSAGLKPEHSWVFWRDADIERAPKELIEDLMSFDRDVIVPNVWRPLPNFLGGQQPYDLNAWVESDAALDLAKTLNEDDVIVEGYAEFPTWRVHLAYLRDEKGEGNQREILDLDGIGGVSILNKAKVFRAGANFPGFTFENHAETEAFGKMSKKMGFSVAGLTQYTIWHLYEPSDDDIKEVAERKAKGLPYD